MVRTPIRLSSLACVFLTLACTSEVPLGSGDPAQNGAQSGEDAGKAGTGIAGGAGGGAAAGANSKGGGGGVPGAAGSIGVDGSVGAGGWVGAGGMSGGIGTGGAGGATGAGAGGSSGAGGAAPVPSSASGGANTGTGGSAGSTLDAGAYDIKRSPVPHETLTISSSDYATFIDNSGKFAFDLFGKLVPQENNVIFSPISIEYALAMTLAGAKGNTAVEMRKAMSDTLDDAVFDSALNKLALDLASRNMEPTDAGPQSVRLRLLDSAWAQKDYDFVPAYLDTLGRAFDAGVNLVDFKTDSNGARLLINRWVADQTAQKIKDLLAPPDVPSSTRLVLVNALYFYGSWMNPFNVNATGDGTFHPLSGVDVTAKMMHLEDTVSYAAGTDYQMIDLPYFGGKLAMSIVLPAAGKFDAIRSNMIQSKDWLATARSSMTSTRVSMSIPRFKFTWGSKSLIDALEALGMNDAFTGAADFSGIEPTRALNIGAIVHKAFIGVDEAGTEAAAATAVVFTEGIPPKPTVTFAADRPFLVLIRDTSGALLFCGQVVDPTIGD